MKMLIKTLFFPIIDAVFVCEMFICSKRRLCVRLSNCKLSFAVSKLFYYMLEITININILLVNSLKMKMSNLSFSNFPRHIASSYIFL